MVLFFAMRRQPCEAECMTTPHRPPNMAFLIELVLRHHGPKFMHVNSQRTMARSIMNAPSTSTCAISTSAGSSPLRPIIRPVAQRLTLEDRQLIGLTAGGLTVVRV